MKKYFSITAILASMFALAFASQQTYASTSALSRVQCSDYWIQSTTDECFNGGNIYLNYGINDVFDTIQNKGDRPIFLFQKDPFNQEYGVSVDFKNLQGSRWSYPTFRNIMPNGGWEAFNLKGVQYLARKIMPNNSPEKFVENVPGSSLVFVDIDKKADRNKPVLQMTFTTRTFGSFERNSVIYPDKSAITIHKEHAFYYGSWCGDGVVDAQFGEKYDDGANNGKPGYASTDCQTKPKVPTPVPGVCDGASHGIAVETAPTKNLCKTGTPSIVVDKGSKFTWTCGGVDGGENASCEAPKKQTPPPVSGVCDQTFHKILRYDPNNLKQYSFFDTYTNKDSHSHTLTSFSVNFKESSDMNKDGRLDYPFFKWYSGFNGNRVIPGGAKDVTIIEAIPPYQLLVPPTKRQKDNFYIEYIVNGKGNSDFSHKECITYEVTWCGDGIVDNYTDYAGRKIEEKCDPNAPGQSPETCDPVTCQPKESPTLEIKKFAKGQDAQTRGQQVSVMPGEEYPYTFEVTNTSKVTAKGAKVVDIFPDAITVVKTGTGTDWSCTQNGQTMTCEYKKPIPAGQKAPTITAIAKLKDTVQSGDSIRNVAGVCELDPTKPANDPNCTPNRDECKPGDKDYNPTTKTCDPSTVVVENGVDLSLKKYVDANNDAQPGSPVEKANNSTFNYTIKVKVESGKATGVTTVKDVLPEKIQSTGNAYGTGWTCNYSGKILTCTSTTEVTTGNYFPDIVVPVRIVNTSNGETIRNDATVHNPNEKDKSCHPGNTMISGNEKFDSTAEGCKVDPKNTDPAVVKTPRSSTPPPPTTPEGPGGYNPAPWCGNYIVEPGEQCDDGPNGSATCGWINSKHPVTGQSLYCKSIDPGKTTTNPAENALTFSIKIPSFSKTAIGSPATSATPFYENGMIVGLGTKIFSLADNVVLGVDPKFGTMVAIPSTHKFQIHADNSQDFIKGESELKQIESTSSVNNLPYWIKEGTNEKYYIIGKNGFKFRTSPGANIDSTHSTCEEYKVTVNGTEKTVAKNCTYNGSDTSEISLFNGSELQKIVASKVSDNKTQDVTLAVKWLGDLTSLASFPVQVIKSQVSTTGSSVSRQLAIFTNFKDRSATFLTKLSTTTSTTTDTNSNKDSFPFGTTVSPLNANIRNTGKVTIISASQLESYKHNGNPNIYAFSDDLTISTDLQMQGVKTILVQGNIIIDNNINYKSGDNNASWAFIAKGGDIKVANKVTNISGVFASLKETNGGNITGLENHATSNILTVDGTLYGNAQELFNKRTYARASNSYDILTTGTVLNYSNRALRNPPPLLSNYLNHYKVQRVVR